MTAISFTVTGIPAPQGSKRHIGNGVLIESSKRVKPWRADIREAAISSMIGRTPLSGPLDVNLTFRLLRPKGHFGAKGLRPSAPTFPAVRPDLDKLTRAALDAIKGVVYADDSQVVRIDVAKVYADVPGLRATVAEIARLEEVA